MLPRRYQQFLSKIAIFLVMFASLVPSVSHALAAEAGGSFLQEICSSNGAKKIVIQTITTRGQQIAAVFDAKSEQQNTPQSIAHHLEHCPFCGVGAANVAITPSNTAWVLLLAEQTNSIDFDYATPFQPSYLQAAHPSRAPPIL